jgi:hypothetical protein
VPYDLELSFLDFYNDGFDSGVISAKNDIKEFIETYSNRNEIILHSLRLDDFSKLLEENGCVYND